jgi:F-type H+-transporting ATPase subunit b
MRNLTWLFSAFVAVALLTGSACAAKEEGATAEKKDEHGGKIDVAEKFGLKRYDLGIYTLIVFFALLGILWKFAWGPMMKGLDKREATLRKAHEDADAARQEAEKVLAEVQARLAKTNDEIRGLLEEARRDAQGVKDQMRSDAAAEIQAERNRIRREIDIAKDEALKDIYQQSIQIATIIATKAIQRDLTPGDQSRLLDDAVREMRTNLGKPRMDS